MTGMSESIHTDLDKAMKEYARINQHLQMLRYTLNRPGNMLFYSPESNRINYYDNDEASKRDRIIRECLTDELNRVILAQKSALKQIQKLSMEVLSDD